jgi:L-2-hydroxycarboxylate dehydrogenase (NAD+)
MSSIHIIDSEALRRFSTQVFEQTGVPANQAQDAADVLVWANLHGVDTHGVRNLKKIYVERLEQGKILSNPEYIVEHETAVSARVDGGTGLGMAAGCWAMRLAIDKARQSGICFVTMHHSFHIGAAGYYPMMAIPHDMIGIAMTGNFFPDGAERGFLPTFGIRPMMSTNPLSISFPTNQEPPFLLDMSTSVVPYNRVEMMMENGQTIPLGWGLDDQGRPTTDPAALKLLLPLGGSREQGGHKGFGLALMVEILCAILSGGWSNGADDSESSANNKYTQSHPAHFFAAFRVDNFRNVDVFKQDMDAMIRAIHDSPAAPGQDQIYVPGEIEHKTREIRLRDGIPLPPNVWEDLFVLSKRYDVPLI